jgi:DNA-binding CsgD family transcriptional regulator
MHDRFRRLATPAPLGATTADDAILRGYASLAADDRRLLDVAACAGRCFDAVTMSVALGVDPLLLAGGIRRCIEAGLLTQRDDGQLRFTHEAAREAIYARLLIFERREMHALIAQAARHDAFAFEQWALAERFPQAHAAGIAAAEDALRRFAYDEAIAIYERLLGMCADGDGRAALLDLMGHAFSRAGRFAEARSAMVRASEACAFSHDAELRAKIAHGLAAICYNQLDTAAAETALDTIPEIVGARSASRWLFRMHVSKALAAVQRADVGAAKTHLDLAIDLPVAAGAHEHRADDALYLRVRGEVCASTGDVAGWLAASDHGLSLAIGRGRDNRVVNLRIARAIEAIALGETKIGIEAADRAARESEIARMDGYHAYARALRGWLQYETGDVRGARIDALAARVRGTPAYDIATMVSLLASAAANDRDALAEFEDREVLERAEASESSQQFAIIAYGFLVADLARGEIERCCGLLSRVVSKLRSPYACGHVLTFAARFGTPEDVAAARRLFGAVSLGPRDAAYAHLFEAFAAARFGRMRTSQRHAHAAALAFEALGLALAHTVALDAAGKHEEARSRAAALGYLEFAERSEAARRQQNRRGRAAAALTKRELDVAAMLDGALTNRDIAERLNIGERTVESHVATILRKTGARSRHEAGAFLRRTGVAPSSDS